MNQPTLVLAIRGKNLSIPVTKALYAAWRIATYPLAIFAGYYFFGTSGAVFTALLLALTNRGQL